LKNYVKVKLKEIFQTPSNPVGSISSSRHRNALWTM